jgi:hypothetical protein
MLHVADVIDFVLFCTYALHTPPGVHFLQGEVDFFLSLKHPAYSRLPYEPVVGLVLD